MTNNSKKDGNKSPENWMIFILRKTKYHIFGFQITGRNIQCNILEFNLIYCGWLIIPVFQLISLNFRLIFVQLVDQSRHLRANEIIINVYDRAENV